MTTDRRLEQLVADALRDAAPLAAPDDLVGDVLGAAGRTRRRPRWLALLLEGPMVRPPVVLVGSPTWRAASVTLAVVLALVVGTLALVTGGWLQRRDATVVVPSTTLVAPTPTVTLAATPVPTPTATPAGLILYFVWGHLQVGEGTCTKGASRESCIRIEQWLAKTDGTEAHRFKIDDPEGTTDDPAAVWVPVDWSPTGDTILEQDLSVTYGPRQRFALIDKTGRVKRRYELGPCAVEGFCGPDLGSLSWSPDGTRLAFAWQVVSFTKSGATSGLSMVDLETGTVTEVDGTRSIDRGDPCWKVTTCAGTAESPRWSPDGLRLVFNRGGTSGEPGSRWTSSALFVVGADGRGLRRVTPKGLYATDASWSPDGSTLVFVNVKKVFDNENDDVTDAGQDIYTIRADGTDLRRLTDDGASSAPRWTRDGRLLFVRDERNWIMAADGGDELELGFDLRTLTNAGCSSCLYPGPDVTTFTQEAHWQPVP